MNKIKKNVVNPQTNCTNRFKNFDVIEKVKNNGKFKW